jgi:hypothetical protein
MAIFERNEVGKTVVHDSGGTVIRRIAGGKLGCGCPELQDARDGKIGDKNLAEKCIL